MPWLTLPFQDPRIEELSESFGISGIPAYVIIDPDGKTITTDGRSLVTVYISNINIVYKIYYNNF